MSFSSFKWCLWCDSFGKNLTQTRKTFKRTLVYQDTNTSTYWTEKRHNSTQRDKLFRFSSHFPSFFTVYLLFKCRFVAWERGLPRIFANLVFVLINKRSFEPFMCLIHLAIWDVSDVIHCSDVIIMSLMWFIGNYTLTSCACDFYPVCDGHVQAL